MDDNIKLKESKEFKDTLDRAVDAMTELFSMGVCIDNVDTDSDGTVIYNITVPSSSYQYNDPVDLALYAKSVLVKEAEASGINKDSVIVKYCVNCDLIWTKEDTDRVMNICKDYSPFKDIFGEV